MKNPFARSTHLRHGIPVARGAFPLVGHVPAVYRGLPEFVRAERAELGRLFWITTGFGMWVLVCAGEEAVAIFKNPSFSSRHLESISPLVAGESLLAHDGPAHRHMRGAMNRAFMPGALSAGAVGSRMARALEGLAARWAVRGHARIVPDIQETTLAIIFGVLGVSLDDLPAWRQKYRDLLLANLNIKLRFPGSPAHRAARAKAWIDARFRLLVEDSRRRAAPVSLLDALVRAEDGDGNNLTDVELVDNLRLLVLGGHETISSTLAWITIALAERPDLWAAMREEAHGAEQVPEDLPAARRFPFAEALFRETVRMHPPFGLITRVADVETELLGAKVPAGTIVGIDLHSTAHDGAHFPDPDAFVPSRWLGRSGAPTPLEISQFGAGPHFCLGYHLAWLESVQFAVAFARVLTRAGLEPRLRDGRAPRPIYLPTERPPADTVLELTAAAGT